MPQLFLGMKGRMDIKYQTKRKKTALLIDNELIKISKIYSLCEDITFTNFLEKAIKKSIPKSFYDLCKRGKTEEAIKKYFRSQ